MASFCPSPRLVMAPDSIPGFVTKKELEKLFGRSHRSLTRDFSAAVRTGDTGVLNHLKLRLEDGRVIEGTDASLDEIQKLSNQGMSPTWFVERSWAEEHYGAREKTPATTKVPIDAPPEVTKERMPSGTPRDSQFVSTLQEQIRDLKSDRDRLYLELQIKNEQITAGNDRTHESNVLMKQLQELLGDVQQRALLPPAGVKTATDGSHSPPQPVSALHDNTAPDESPGPEKVSATRDSILPATGTPARKTSKARSKASPKTDSSPARKRSSSGGPKRKPSRKKTRLKKKEPVSRFEKHTPTLHRAFRGLFRL